MKVSDYYPISLVTSVYKIIMKVLSPQLSEILGDIISLNQSDFLGGRQILDTLLVANKVVRYTRYSKGKGLVLKLDTKKTYDQVNWKFLDSVVE